MPEKDSSSCKPSGSRIHMLVCLEARVGIETQEYNASIGFPGVRNGLKGRKRIELPWQCLKRDPQF